MSHGYIYVLRNPHYDAYLVKIGLTTRMPDVRAKELYIGSSGVPTPFEIATAYSVGDCKLAEKQTHKRLAAYRINGRREFFRTSPSVAAYIAYDTCEKINNELGLPPPELFQIDKTTPLSIIKNPQDDLEKFTADFENIERLTPTDLRYSPLGTSDLTPEQLDRIEILKMQLSNIYPDKIQEILSGFSRDTTPEREICVWEHITKAYLTIEQVEFASDGLRHEAFHLLLLRSWSPTDEVLNSFTPKHFTLKSAKRLLSSYEMKPKPLIIRKRPHLNIK
jgi:hypothetical protein